MKLDDAKVGDVVRLNSGGPLMTIYAIDKSERIFYGFSADTDIVTASVKALIDAVNKMTGSYEE